MNIAKETLDRALEKGVDEYLSIFIEKYKEILGEEFGAEEMNKLNGYQHSLLSYHYFQKEVMEGGFIQLIQNGYGGYIFDNPFAKAMRLFGAKDFSKLIYKAKEIYDLHKADLTRDCSEEEFMAMYEQYEVFDELEESYMEMEEEVTTIIADYVQTHPELFLELND